MCNSALDFFCFLFVLLHSTDAFAIRVMPHAIGIEWTICARAEAYFLRLFCYAVEAFGSDRFERTQYLH